MVFSDFCSSRLTKWRTGSQCLEGTVPTSAIDTGATMNTLTLMTRLTLGAAGGALALTGCAGTAHDDAAPEPTATRSEAAADASNPEAGAHDHDPDGGPAPEGIQDATDPRYPVGEAVILNTDHMPGMDGAEATISGAFDTTTYSV